MAATEWTRNEHAEYLRWCEEHPEGFAWNCHNKKLHKAKCPSARKGVKVKGGSNKSDTLNQSTSVKYITAESRDELRSIEPRAAEESRRCGACGG